LQHCLPEELEAAQVGGRQGDMDGAAAAAGLRPVGDPAGEYPLQLAEGQPLDPVRANPRPV
jgi:hypothetical protein